ncbi:hypothetical protein [Priestia megaterium]|uniref:hypothetical protein n=1 Tax=Priestia megaterium TaxID=1404 RepID=UPI00204066E4|nr:hypothetical protein [Priestia megaterium]MCM3195813.1 hypothetical protein [Priestia megaterium]
MAGIESSHIKNIGHDNSDKILNELAQKRTTEELFSNTNEYTKQQVLLDLEEQLNESS